MPRSAFLVFASISATACGVARFKTEHLSNGVATVAPRGAAPIESSTVPLTEGAYDLVLSFFLPRAQQLQWTVACPGTEAHGTLGQTFEVYRERRLNELRAQRERDRRNAAAVTSAVVGAVTPTVDAHAAGGNGQVNGQVDAHVSGQAVGVAAGEAVASSIEDVIELPPGDVGAGLVRATVHVATKGDGACTLTATADNPISGSYELLRVRDLVAEAQARDEAAKAAALRARGELHAELVTFGADPSLRQRQREAEARARAEAQARADETARLRAETQARERAELLAKAEAEGRIRAEAEARERAELRAKTDAEAQIRAEAEAREDAKLRAQAEAELRVRVELDARAHAEARAKASVEARIRQLSLAARTSYLELLVSWGADPNLRSRLQAERARHDQEVRLQIELRQQREREQRLAIEAREHEQRLAIEAREREQRLAIETREREQRLAIEARDREAREQRLAFEREEHARRKAAEHERQRIAAHQIEVALAARGELRAYLVTIGARERPPMPAPVPENPGAMPFDGAAWIAGRWIWTGGVWTWESGGWRDRSRFGDAGGEVAVGVGASGTVGVGTSGTVSSGDSGVGILGTIVETVTDHSTTITTVDTTVRDHRSESPPKKTEPRDPKVRDHRSESPPPPKKTEPTDPKVRDHRSESPPPPKKTEPTDPKVRDHR